MIEPATLFVAIIAGALGGFTRICYLYLHKDDEWTIIVKEQTKRARLVRGVPYIFIGIVASVLAWGLSEGLEGAIGALTTGIISGFLGLSFIDQYVQIIGGQAETDKAVDQLTDQTEVLEAIKELLKNANAD